MGLITTDCCVRGVDNHHISLDSTPRLSHRIGRLPLHLPLLPRNRTNAICQPLRSRHTVPQPRCAATADWNFNWTIDIGGRGCFALISSPLPSPTLYTHTVGQIVVRRMGAAEGSVYYTRSRISMVVLVLVVVIEWLGLGRGNSVGCSARVGLCTDGAVGGWGLLLLLLQCVGGQSVYCISVCASNLSPIHCHPLPNQLLAPHLIEL